ncbi:MAG: hypothetical protein EPN43_06705 [Jatrophihabitans sp.]|nr:MAG: hypothetical protein EPN43_06705 [Jatrophihabitans sp.]
MLSDRRHATADLPFLLGLAAFLVGHLCYLVGFLRHGVHPPFLLAGLLIVGGTAGLALPRVLGSVRARRDGTLFAAVAGYAAVVGVMAIAAVGTGAILTAAGGLLFLGSDTALARDRFVAPVARGPLLVIVSYHLGQLLIVLGLLR